VAATSRQRVGRAGIGFEARTDDSREMAWYTDISCIDNNVMLAARMKAQQK
jgi:hypothetical protein